MWKANSNPVGVTAIRGFAKTQTRACQLTRCVSENWEREEFSALQIAHEAYPGIVSSAPESPGLECSDLVKK